MWRLLVVVLGLGFSFSAMAADQLLRLQGSNTIGAKLAPALVKVWLQKSGYSAITEQAPAHDEEQLVGRNAHGDTLTVTISAHGSATAFSGLLAGKADIGMASRRIEPSEVTALAGRGAMDMPECEHVLGLDGIAVIVNAGNPINKLDTATLRDIFAGRIKKWSQLGGANRPIHVYARDELSGTYDTFKNLVLTTAEPLTGAAKRFDSNADLSDSVAADPDGIGFVGLPYVRKSKLLAISEQGTRPIRPAPFSVATEDYALARRLFLYVPSKPVNELAQQFAAFAQSEQGQQVVDNEEFISQHIIADNETIGADAPAEYRQLAAHAKRLSLNFRFREGTVELDSKAHRDLERLVNYMNGPQGAGHQLMLFGFADASEVMPYQSLELAVHRADTVADMLIERNVSPLRVRGYGNTMPVAANDTEAGRQKNRRVEVWITDN